jgi:histidyl-tRNA synthetase
MQAEPMALSTQPYKGTRDFYPEDFRLRQYIFDCWRRVSENFGYEPYDASVIEPLELYTAKTSEEIVREQTFSFEDRGGRMVTMRPEMTPTVSRIVAARRQELGYPLRLYSIPNCFRYERMQRGRSREFWQYNADLFGIEGIEAEAEIFMLTDQLMKVFGATEDMYEIRVNSRKLLNARITAAKPRVEPIQVLRLIDRIEKMPNEDFAAELGKLVESADQLIAFLTGAGLDEVTESEAEGLKALLARVQQAGIGNVRFVPAAARGFDYYTDIVFEVFDLDPENNRSIFGGGRYDGLVGAFGVEPLPSIGLAIGEVGMENFLRTHELLPKLRSETQVFVAPLSGQIEAAEALANQLRQNGVNVALGLEEKKPEQYIKIADKKQIPYIVFVGEEEAKTNTFKAKNLRTKEESQPLNPNQLASFLTSIQTV